jgi:hypothetical protein
MKTMDNVLVSFHGRGKFEQGTSSPILPYAIFLSNYRGLALHQIGRGLPQPHMLVGVEPHSPYGPPLSLEAPQEEEDNAAKQD